jgi:hypothetical protein
MRTFALLQRDDLVCGADWRATTTIIGGSSRERNMRESEVQQRVTELPQPKSKTREEGSESVEEPSRALHVTLVQRFRRHERIRLLILGMGLLVIMLSILFFVISGTIVPLFETIVVVPLLKGSTILDSRLVRAQRRILLTLFPHHVGKPEGLLRATVAADLDRYTTQISGLVTEASDALLVHQTCRQYNIGTVVRQLLTALVLLVC